MFSRRHFLALALAAGLMMSAPQASAAAPADAVTQVKTLCAGLMQLRKESAAKDFAQRYADFALVIDQVFDVQQFLRGSVGLRWGDLSAGDQASLLKVFREYVIASYVANFNADSGEIIQIAGDTRAVGKDLIVPTSLVAGTSDPVHISYQLRDQGAGFKVVDVLIDDTISQVAVQRSDFRAQLAGQANAAQLIATLADKVKTLSGGAVAP